MELSAEEREAVENRRVVKYVIPDSRVEWMVVREDLLDPLRVRSDYSPCDPDDLSRLTSEVLHDEDWTMPEGRPQGLTARKRDAAGAFAEDTPPPHSA